MIGRSVIASLALLLIAAAPGEETDLVVDVGNVRAKGNVHVDICPEAQFLKEGCPYTGDAPAQVGVTRVVVHGVPPGRYAAQAFLDENRNGKLDRNFIGMPKEGVGFSNDARIVMAPPKFSDAVFVHGSAAQSIRFSLRYFLGPKGPSPKS